MHRARDRLIACDPERPLRFDRIRVGARLPANSPTSLMGCCTTGRSYQALHTLLTQDAYSGSGKERLRLIAQLIGVASRRSPQAESGDRVNAIKWQSWIIPRWGGVGCANRRKDRCERLQSARSSLWPLLGFGGLGFEVREHSDGR